MSTFLILVGFFGFLFGVCFLVYSFFSKKKRSKKKISIGILVAFIVMVIGGALAPPTTGQADVHKDAKSSSSSVSVSSESREKDEKKAKELAKKKKAEEQKAKEEAEKKHQEEQKAKEAEKKRQEEQKVKEAEKKRQEEQKAKEAEKKRQEEQKAKEAEKKRQEEINQKTSTAKTILEQAEANPTRDNYNAALSAIQSIPGGNQELLNRLVNVDSTIKSNEAAEAERQKQQAAEAQRQAQEQQAAEAQRQAEQQNNSYTVDGQWSIAANGMVFARSDSGKYYSRVTNPNNYQYMTQIDADNAGYSRAPRGNQYARP
ncbi:cell envelope integrity TolA family protein [Enterococcus faecium]|uniref:cell envelope integrity protein TolA n=1 Tax=Enterococcus faecium TaxID=1352 RepID=UPI00376FA2C0